MPTATQRKNLLKLAAYLESLPADYQHFGMQYYADHRGSCDLPMNEELYAAKKPTEFLANCGTVACAVGHGPAAGIKPRSDEFESNEDYFGSPFETFDWSSYAERVFGAERYSEEFGFLFGSTWSGIDDHHYGAAARIRYFLATGPIADPYADGIVRKYAPYRKGSRSAKRREIEAAAQS